MQPLKIDHCVIHVSDWERSNRFYATVLGAEVVPRQKGFAYRLGDFLLNCHGPGVTPNIVAQLPVAPGNSDLCFEWPGPIATALAHLAAQNVSGRVGSGRNPRREGRRNQRLFSRSRRFFAGIHELCAVTGRGACSGST